MIEIKQVSESVWAHTEGKTRGNVACIKLLDSLVMIDTGMDPVTMQEFRRVAEETTEGSFSYLVNTHAHTDHVFGNQVFEDCKILATKSSYERMEKNVRTQWKEERLKERMERNPELRRKWENLRITLPTETFEGSYTIEEGEKKVHIEEAGGHTEGDAYIYVPDEEILITGDLLFAHTYPYGGDPTADPYAWIHTLDEMIALQPKRVIPGHGPVTSIPELKTQRNYLDSLTKEMERAVEQGVTKEELSSMDWPEFPYEVNVNRRTSMLARIYEAVKQRSSKET